MPDIIPKANGFNKDIFLKNKKMKSEEKTFLQYHKLKDLQPKEHLNLVVEGFCDKTLEYLAAADVFLGKAGASSVADATYFGAALIITKYATSMERDNAAYYLQDVKNALRIFNAREAVDKLEAWLCNPKELITLQNNALRYHDAYGSERSADVLWEMLCEQFPVLQSKNQQKEQEVVDSRVMKGLLKKGKKGKNRAKNVV